MPPPSQRPHASTPHRRRRALLRFTAAFVVSVLLGMGGAAGLVRWGMGQIDRSDVAGLTTLTTSAVRTDERPPGSTPRLVNVLVVGNDSREGLSPAQIKAFGTGDAEGNRTDTIMLVQLEIDGAGRGAVLSFPRDLLTTRCDGTRGRINAAYGIGVERNGDGPSCVVQTVSDLTGVGIHHYVEVSFAGFLDVVDAIGGVGLYLDEPLSDAKAHIDLPAGCVRLKGPDALGFVRARSVDNDFGRIARQQRFLKETVREATEIGVLANPARMVRIIDAAASSLRTDDGLSLGDMRRLAMGMRRLTAGGLEVYTVPGESVLTGGVWYVQERQKAAAKLYASFRSGDVVTDEPPPPPEALTEPKPPVTVVNGTDESGLAEAAADVLETKGYTVTDVGTADLGGLARTRILHPPHLAGAAADLAELFPGADVIAGVEDLPLTVKVGAELQARALARRGEGGADRGGATAASNPEPTYSGAQMTDVDC